jgi:hypothetical protein
MPDNQGTVGKNISAVVRMSVNCSIPSLGWIRPVFISHTHSHTFTVTSEDVLLHNSDLTNTALFVQVSNNSRVAV